MLPAHPYCTIRKTRLRQRRSRRKQQQQQQQQRQKQRRRRQQTKDLGHLAKLNFASVDSFQEILHDLKHSNSHLSCCSVAELEPICQQIVRHQMSTAASNADGCPLMCLLCQNQIHGPTTLYCGHTFCERCIADEHFASTIACPRCPRELQRHTPSPIVQARESSYQKNCFLQQLIDRSETLRSKSALIARCHQGLAEYSKGNYQQAVEICTQIIEQCADDYLALYCRANAYTALKEFHSGLIDATRVVTLKPQWIKGHLCQSEILFEMKHFTGALRSSLKALVMDPEDQLGKQTMARHLFAVLHNDEDKDAEATVEEELKALSTSVSTSDSESNAANSGEHPPTSTCPLTQNASTCFCSALLEEKFHARDFECPICASLLWSPVTTPCGHAFCRECLIRSVDNTQAQCPLCKSSLGEFFPMLIRGQVKQTDAIAKLIEACFSEEYQERRRIHEQESTQGALSSSAMTNTEPTIVEVPIFVCVLALPNCPCPLHVFEPRYRLMMRRTIETEARAFGMCSYDEQTDTFADYGTLLYIRGLMYTPDGRSIVDTIGQRRFRVLERGMLDGYHTAKVELLRDHPLEEHEFQDLFQLNRNTYNRVRQWFDRLHPRLQAAMSQQLDGYPLCDDLTRESVDGPSWTWIMLSLLPIESLLQYTALASQSLRIRLQMINDTIDFQSEQQPQPEQETTTPAHTADAD